MSSLYEELCEKLARDPRLTKRGGPRADLGLLLFNAREELHALWLAAERCTRAVDGDNGPGAGNPPAPGSGNPEPPRTVDPEALAELRAAVNALRPIFGPRENAGTPGAGGKRR